MKNGSRRTVQILVLLLVILPVAMAWHYLSNRVIPEEQAIPTPVYVGMPEIGSLEHTITAYGNVRSANQVTIIPKVAGTVTAMMPEVGRPVAAGDVVAEIDREAYEVDLKRAEAAYGNAASTWERINRLYAAGNATRQDWENARAARDAAEAQAAGARLRYDWTRVTSPADGVVLVRHTNPGALVSPDAGTPLYTIGSLEDLEVKLNIGEADYPSFNAGISGVRLRPEAHAGVEFSGEVLSVAPWVNPITRNFSVTCRVPPSSESGVVIRPGMLLEAEFVLKTEEDAVSLPSGALTGGRSVWEVTEDRRAVFRVLENPRIVAGRLVVPPDWAGRRFVTEGQHFLAEGGEVSILGKE